MSLGSAPTPEQIQTVQTNLTNMQRFNDYVFNHGTPKVLNAYLLLSEPDSSDPGLTVGLNIFEGIFNAISGEFGPVGSFASSFLSGMVSSWASNTPPSLGASFSSLINRLQATNLATDQQLATYYQDVAGNWNTSFTYNNNTTTLADLATVNFPAETDPFFEKMARVSLFALDQTIWLYILQQSMQCTYWQAGRPEMIDGNPDSPPIAETQAFYSYNPAFYHTWVWHNSSGCGDRSGWLISEYSLGASATMASPNAISNDAAAYLFIDSTPGTVINPDGLYTRQQIFTGLGIPQNTIDVPGSTAGKTLSIAYLRAMKEGKTLTALIEKEGRESVQKRVIEHALADTVFRNELKMRPRQALERFLGVKIAEVIALSVVVEDPGTFGVIIPWHPQPGTAAAQATPLRGLSS